MRFFQDVRLASLSLRSTAALPRAGIQTSEQRNHYELVSGDDGRLAKQIDVVVCGWGPVGEDGSSSLPSTSHRQD